MEILKGTQSKKMSKNETVKQIERWLQLICAEKESDSDYDYNYSKNGYSDELNKYSFSMENYTSECILFLQIENKDKIVVNFLLTQMDQFITRGSVDFEENVDEFNSGMCSIKEVSTFIGVLFKLI